MAAYMSDVYKYKLEGMQSVPSLLTKTRQLDALEEYCCEKPRTEIVLTDEAAMERWFKREQDLVRWCGERWMGFMRSLLHVSPIEAKRPMLLAHPEFWDDACSRSVELVIAKWWEIIKVANSGRCGNYATKGPKKNPRRYHTLGKIKTMIEKLDTHRGELEREDIVELAIWFHDIEYDTTRPLGDNERASFVQLKAFSEEARAALADDGHLVHTDHALGRLAMMQLEEWIRETSHHFDGTLDHFLAAPQYDFDFFMDCDVCVLGLPTKEYEAYARDVRREYQHIPLALYRTKRTEVLTRFLAYEHLFRTQEFRDKYDAQARANMRWETERIATGHFPTDPMDDEADSLGARERNFKKMDTNQDGKMSRVEFEARHGSCQYSADAMSPEKEALPAGWVQVPARSGCGVEFVHTEAGRRQGNRPN